MGLETSGCGSVPVHLHVNDADPDRGPLLEANLAKADLSAEISTMPATSRWRGPSSMAIALI